MQSTAKKILLEETIPMENIMENKKATVPPKPPTLLGWFLQKGYTQGVFWAIMISLVSVTNDVLMRALGERLHVVQIIFFRFLFSMLTVLPLMIPKGTSLFKTSKPKMHIWRALIGVAAIGICCYSVNVMPLSENTTIMFAQPLFFLPMAVVFLKERVEAPRWIATIIGFLGLMIILRPGTEAFKLVALAPITAAILFATLDIFAKKMVSNEHTLTMMFYFGLGTTIAAAIPLLFVWQTPTLQELALLILLGIGANLIQVCIYRAFTATEASALMPFRYVEFIFAALFGFLLFSEIPTLWTLGGAALIVASTFYISYIETMKEKRG
ncbi:MAG TPA: DMT family transporter [Alphaproteobacteria bacterium]|nr:DMT family transporter [Alphaproteobacteria bacterium]